MQQSQAWQAATERTVHGILRARSPARVWQRRERQGRRRQPRYAANELGSIKHRPVQIPDLNSVILDQLPVPRDLIVEEEEQTGPPNRGQHRDGDGHAQAVFHGPASVTGVRVGIGHEWLETGPTRFARVRATAHGACCYLDARQVAIRSCAARCSSTIVASTTHRNPLCMLPDVTSPRIRAAQR